MASPWSKGYSYNSTVVFSFSVAVGGKGGVGPEVFYKFLGQPISRGGHFLPF